MPYTFADAVVDERTADDYERSRKARARRAHERGLIETREFERECYEAEREACNMRAVVVHKFIHSK